MIVVDSSALMAIVLDEPSAEDCDRALQAAVGLLISAGTMAEAMIVARRRSAGAVMQALLDGLAMDVLPVDAAFARRMADAYDRWGKGVHPAGLNLGDCFSYVAAMDRRCPLLFVGQDFARTDVARVL